MDAPSSTFTAPSTITPAEQERAACMGAAASHGSEQVLVEAASSSQGGASEDAVSSCEQAESAVHLSEAPIRQPVAQDLDTGSSLALSKQPPPAVAHAFSSSFYDQTPMPSMTADQSAELLDSSTASHADTAVALHPTKQQQQQGVSLKQIWVYPIKSCAGFAPASWPLGQNGLLYDREWALVDGDGAALTQKKLPRLATIRPTIHMDTGMPLFLLICHEQWQVLIPASFNIL